MSSNRRPKERGTQPKVWASRETGPPDHPIVEYLKLENQDIYEDKMIAEEFAKHFSTVGYTYANKIPKPNLTIGHYLSQIPNNDHTIFMEPTTSLGNS